MTIDSLRAMLGKSSTVPREWRGVRGLIPPLLDFFQNRYPGPHGREISLGFVPGRIEVLGRHTDYAGGRTLVCAIDRGFLCVSAANMQGIIRMAEESDEFPPIEFPMEPSITPRVGHWSNYPMTMARRLIRNFGPTAGLTGVDMVFSSSLPVGSGMSGSSALMMMTFLGIAGVNRLHDAPFFRRNIRDGIDLSMYLACAENGQSFRELTGDKGVGTFGGSEDHAAILNGRDGYLSLFRFRPSVLEEELRWPREWRMVVAFSGVRAEKTREALDKYNLVSRRATLAVKEYNRLFSARSRTLREVAVHAKGHLGKDWLNEVTERFQADSRFGRELDLADRIRQFALEDRRFIPAAVRAVRERDLGTFGKNLTASHRASRSCLHNIADEIEFLHRSALHLGAAGASGFGGGFGGSILAVLPSTKAEKFCRAWEKAYAKRYPEQSAGASFSLAAPGPGIRSWDSDGPARYVEKIFQV
jgi:galactokinase